MVYWCSSKCQLILHSRYIRTSQQWDIHLAGLFIVHSTSNYFILKSLQSHHHNQDKNIFRSKYFISFHIGLHYLTIPYTDWLKCIVHKIDDIDRCGFIVSSYFNLLLVSEKKTFYINFNSCYHVCDWEI